MRGSAGCYTTSGDHLALVKSGKKDPAVLPFTVHTDELVLESPGKPSTTYGREAAGPWYDREHIDLKPPRGDRPWGRGFSC